MLNFTSVLLNAEKNTHPLAMALDKNEAGALGSRLSMRLELTENELDFSPSSLHKLEKELINHLRAKAMDTEDNDEILSLIRELAGYIGTVLSLHANGRWLPMDTLWNTHIEFRDVDVEKEGRKYVAPELVYSLGNLAAITLDKISQGIPPNLYKYYRNAKRKTFREN